MGETAHATHHEGEHRSRWPFVAAIGAGALYAGLGLAVLATAADVFPTVVAAAVALLGIVGLCVGLAGWVVEAFLGERVGRGHGRIYRLATVCFLGTDVATFGAGFVYYFFVRAGAWPPTHLPDLLGSLVLVNTAILLASSVTLHYAHHALSAGHQRRFRALLGVTVALGAVFLAGQAYEYYELLVVEGFGLQTGVFGSAFYGLTGLHGFHVFLGVVVLAVVFGRALRGAYGAGRDTSVATASLYWHFVDAVWLFLVVVLYVGAAVGV
ncbi:cox-type terminal oxidase subunit III [Halorientalis sp. IM1011]|uniref:cytochrome c oxidase subunit 3 n=1 Tax=Halorientalis sp. IM1011 TaxID=1932360 RepID=UPI00097CC8A1|nr:heme-copper oxidase subunit III [Halorientalis sp. IM1011]AQL42290.1 cox-type terminal oxidase subunit III [Halorientalis sp. IM1011]